MMNPIIESLHTRKSARVFESKAIDAQLKEQILSSAMQAPTAGNQQLYTILDITDQLLKDQLSVTCDNQPFIASAPMVLIFCADMLKWVDAYKAAGCEPRPVGTGDLLLAMQDTVIAAQNAVTAAWSLGIGSCYIGDILENAEQHRRMLCLPETVMPATMVVFGYPTAGQQARPKPKRVSAEFIVHENSYHRLTDIQLRQMMDIHTGTKSFEAYMKAFCMRKYESDFAKEMNRSVQVYLETCKKESDANE